MMEPGEALQSLDHALEAASRAEKRLREAIEVLPEGIVFLDENDRYILWNKRYSEIYERSADLLEPGVRLADTLRIGCGTIGIRVDITDLKQKEENFRLLFERNPLAMLVYDVDTGLIRAANESACTFFGYEREEMAGLPAQALFPST